MNGRKEGRKFFGRTECRCVELIAHGGCGGCGGVRLTEIRLAASIR